MKYIFFVLAVALLVVIWIVLTYRYLKIKHKKIKDCFSLVEVQLGLRFGLISKLVKALGDNGRAKEMLSKLNLLEKSYADKQSSKEKMIVNAELSLVLNELISLSGEGTAFDFYSKFIDLQQELFLIEENLSVLRKEYDRKAEAFNNLLCVFPNNVLNILFKFKKEPVFCADDSDKVFITLNFE